MGLHHPMQDILPGGASATVDRLPVHQHQQQQQQQQQEEEEGQRREGEWERHVEQEEKRRVEDEEYHHHAAKEYHAKEYQAKEYHHDHYRMASGEADEELPESPNYNQSGFQDSSQYGETSASASNSGEDLLHILSDCCV